MRLNIDAFVDALSSTLIIGFSSRAIHAAVFASVTRGAHRLEHTDLATIFCNLGLNRAIEVLRCDISTILWSA